MSAGAGWQDYAAPKSPPQSGDGWQDFQPKPKAAASAPQGLPLAPTPWGRMKQAYEGTLPLLDHDMATLAGVGSIARGVAGGAKGAYNTLKEAVNAWNDPRADVGDTMLPDPHVEQVRGAVRDINASPDPTGTYLQAAGETAGQGAGAAIDSLAMEGAARGLPKATGAITDLAPSIGPKVKALGRLAAEDAASHIPVAGRAFRRPSLMDYVNAAKTKAAPPAAPEIFDATGENKPFAGGMDEYAPPKAAPAVRFRPDKGAPYPAAPTPEQLNPSLVSPSRSLPGQNSPEVIRPPAKPIPQRPGLALPPGLQDVPATSSPSLLDQVKAYRARDVGEQGVPYNPESHAQASMSQADVERMMPSRGEMRNAPQELVGVDLSQTPGFSLKPGPNAADWVKFHGEVPESAVSRPPLIDQIRESVQASGTPQTYTPQNPSLLDQIREQVRQIQAQPAEETPTPSFGRQLRIEGQDVDPDTDLSGGISESVRRIRAARGLPPL